MDHRMTFGRRTALSGGLAAGLSTLAAPRLARAQAPHRVRFTLDWAVSGLYAFVAAGERQGIFRDAGVDMQVSRGFGSGRVPVDLAAGTYDMGIGDITPALRFMAENPDRGIVAVMVPADQSALCATVRADGPVRTPRELEGRTLAAPEFDGGRQVFPVFARAAGFDAAKVQWMNVSPELREPMLVQRRAEGITGFITSTGMSLKGLGMDWPAQRIFRYREQPGLDFFGSAILTTKRFAEERPEAVRAALLGLSRALIWSHRNPDAAIAHLKARESLTDVPIEAERQQVFFREMLLSDNVRANGLSHVDPARLERQIEAVRTTFNLSRVPGAAEAYTDAFLPARNERTV